MILDFIAHLVKHELPSVDVKCTAAEFDNLCLMQQGSKVLNSKEELQDSLGDFSLPILKLISNIQNNMKKSDSNFALVS
jgi:hypothetical protein